MPNNKAPDGRRSRPFKVICISIYKDDLDAMDKLVTALKESGITTMNRSWLIREAIARVDVAQIVDQVTSKFPATICVTGLDQIVCDAPETGSDPSASTASATDA
jgi:hypothetical protein